MLLDSFVHKSSAKQDMGGVWEGGASVPVFGDQGSSENTLNMKTRLQGLVSVYLRGIASSSGPLGFLDSPNHS